MSFNLEEIDTCPAYGWVVGVGSDILIRKLKNGAERRNDETDIALHTFVLPMVNIDDEEYAESLKSAYLACRTSLYPFLAKDYTDYRHGFASNDYAPMQFAVGDGSTALFQLKKRYGFGSRSWDRDISKPQAGHKVYANGIDTGLTASLETGIVDFGGSPPANGVILTWTGEFRVPVRFDSFEMKATIDSRKRAGEYAVSCNCSLVEVPFE
jgi:uncharacterized protein (TIGR02217 family)